MSIEGGGRGRARCLVGEFRSAAWTGVVGLFGAGTVDRASAFSHVRERERRERGKVNSREDKFVIGKVW